MDHHISENFGSVENILSAKMEIISGIRDNGFLILNADDKMLKTVIENFDKYTSNLGKNITLITYGIENKNADFVGEIIEKTETNTRYRV